MTKKQKYIRCEMRDRTIWDIPAKFIAEDRAKYYAERDTGETEGKEFNKIFKEEVKYALKYTEELLDWAENNLNWSDVEDRAEFQEQGEVEEPDYEEDWVNGEKEIIAR